MHPVTKIILIIYLVAQVGFVAWTHPQDLANPHTWQWAFWGGITIALIIDTIQRRKETKEDKQ